MICLTHTLSRNFPFNTYIVFGEVFFIYKVHNDCN